jgi:hypothetical protein
MSGATFPPQTIRQQLIATGQSNPFDGAYSGDLMLAAERRIGQLETDMATATRTLDRLVDALGEIDDAIIEARTTFPAGSWQFGDDQSGDSQSGQSRGLAR